MTQEEINKYSVLMAEFMGYKYYEKWENPKHQCYYPHYYLDIDSIYIEDKVKGVLEYYSNYNELMPVWFKFNKECGLYNYPIKNITDAILENETPLKAFEELGKAIEWYNTIKK
jgi:hypothetical protein